MEMMNYIGDDINDFILYGVGDTTLHVFVFKQVAKSITPCDALYCMTYSEGIMMSCEVSIQ